MTSTGKKIAAKVAATVAVSGSVFVLSATSATASPAPASAVALAGPQAAPAGCRPPSLAHCYTEATMHSYIDRVLPMIVQFFRVKYKAMPEPSSYYFIPEGQQARSACQNQDGGPLDADTYAYCPVDHNVYLGQAAMWRFYHEDGDVAPAVGLAHEWGHNVQSRAGIPTPTTSVESVNYENQADCVAGAWIQYAGQRKWLEQEDFRSIVKFVQDIASAESPDRDHGDLTERGKAMSLGLKNGLGACNKFYPGTPIFDVRD
ncbi:MAG: neutral zinc metallopeptidase [Pseudonocardiaceae bacterium]